MIDKEDTRIMQLPEHYVIFYKRFIRFAIVMLVFALVSGILFQESSKKAPFSDALVPGVHLEATIHLALLHGHVLLIGTLIPLAVLWLMHLGLTLGCPPVSRKVLSFCGGFYAPGAVLTLGLMLYKGYYYLLAVRGGNLNFVLIEQTLFGGKLAIRHGLYGLAHTSLALSLLIFGIALWQTLNKSDLSAE